MQSQTDPVTQFDPAIIETCAQAAHEVNRAYCAALGDTSQQPWDLAPEWQRESCRAGVRGALSGNTPRQSHESWLAHKAADGWRYGLVKDVDAKTHPCFVPYDELPPEQQAKDTLYLSTVRATFKALVERGKAQGESIGKTKGGQVGYEAYAQSTGGKTFDGRDMPTWEQLPERIQRAWIDATQAAHRALS